MKIAVIGAGAIGGLVAGYLKFRNEDVTLIARPQSAEAIKKNGLNIGGSRGDINVRIDAASSLDFSPDLAILAVKTQDCEKAVNGNLKFLKDSVILTTQNGVQAENIVSRYIPKENIVSGIVMFGSTYLELSKIVHNFEGPWIIGNFFKGKEDNLSAIYRILKKAFPVVISEDIKGMKYLKIFINANNCIPAILGVSMQEAFRDLEISRISIAIWKEALEVVKKSGIKITSLPDFPVERITGMVAMPPLEAAKVFSGVMVNLSKEPLYGSILQSIKRNRPSEIEYINGEFVHLAKQNKVFAPLNERLVNLVYRVEITKKFLTKEQLLLEVKEFCK
ncbi:MAG: 2-dehydropantoate 2-reductase [Candidatus Omnitrophica bacterium]|nr:2-dehydropantoate 2-reductase [Candidatus Omnitrophota bacterium]